MTKDHIGSQDIAICAALGSAIAGVVLGVVGSLGLMAFSASIGEAISLLAVSVLAGMIFSVFIGTPIGIGIGFVISRLVGVGIGYAALAAALTGTVYPLFFLVGGLLTGAIGLSDLVGSFLLFAAVGAGSGATAYWLVIARKRQLAQPFTPTQ
jgi:hypothetical protein